MFFKGLIILLAGLFTIEANATPFANGGFEDGTTTGWVTGQGTRAGILNDVLSAASFLPQGSNNSAGSRSAIIDTSYVDPLLGSKLGSTVYSGSYAYRAEDTFNGGYASVISQKVVNYTDSNIFFAWKAVLENGGHSEIESAEMVIELLDNTTNTLIISRIYNAGAGGTGVDSRFLVSNGLFYTPDWQVEQLAIDASLAGHDFTLTLLAADCEPSGHTGYAYLDGFGAVIPTATDVPEPMTLPLFALGGLLIYSRRRQLPH